jgi:hypothetical protein
MLSTRDDGASANCAFPRTAVALAAVRLVQARIALALSPERGDGFHATRDPSILVELDHVLTTGRQI